MSTAGEVILLFKVFQTLEKLIDDILTYHEDFPSHVQGIFDLLGRCRQAKITLNAKKFKFAQQKVEYAGFLVGVDGISADPNKVKAIAEFPIPQNIKDLRSFLGMCQQLADFSGELASAATPLRSLLREKNVFLWTPDHTASFEQVKKTLVSPPTLGSIRP